MKFNIPYITSLAEPLLLCSAYRWPHEVLADEYTLCHQNQGMYEVLQALASWCHFFQSNRLSNKEIMKFACIEKD